MSKRRLYMVSILSENGRKTHPRDEWADFVMSAEQLTAHGESGWVGVMAIRSIDIVTEGRGSGLRRRAAETARAMFSRRVLRGRGRVAGG